MDKRPVQPTGLIGNELQLSHDEERSVGTLLGCFLGDALGAPVEGWSPKRIVIKHGEVKDIIAGLHMGMHQAGLRTGMYTDDTNSTLALAHSLVEKKALVPLHAAHQYGRFWQSEPRRGYPDSAQKVMLDVLKGEDITKTGTKTFPEGSFANGGAMRISPIGIAFKNATDEQRHEAVKMAIISSHVHPQAIDGAWLIASAISKLSKVESHKDLQPLEFFRYIKGLSKDSVMQERLEIVEKLVTDFLNNQIQPNENVNVPSIIQIAIMLGDDFQIKAVDAVACALYCICTNWSDPERCLITAVSMGGDTDTVAAISGSVVGALHGTSWIPKRWYAKLENGARGRDWVVNLGKDLAKLDLNSVKEPTPQEAEEILSESANIEITESSDCKQQ